MTANKAYVPCTSREGCQMSFNVSTNNSLKLTYFFNIDFNLSADTFISIDCYNGFTLLYTHVFQCTNNLPKICTHELHI